MVLIPSSENGWKSPNFYVLDFGDLGIWAQNKPVGPRGNPDPFFWLKFNLEFNGPNPKF